MKVVHNPIVVLIEKVAKLFGQGQKKYRASSDGTGNINVKEVQ
jgi:hypothetical protein